MPEINVYESERNYLQYTMKYSSAWSEVAKRGQPVKQSELASPGVFFYVKEKDSDASAISGLDLNDGDTTEIEWLDKDGSDGTNTGDIRIKLGANTNGQAGDKRVYELRLKFDDNTYITVEKGTINILESTVDQA